MTDDNDDTTERETALQQREAAFTSRLVRHELSQALAGARVKPEAIGDASAILASLAQVELDQADRVTKVTIGGESYTDINKAVGAFLKSRAYLVAPEESPKPRTAAGTFAPATPPPTTTPGNSAPAMSLEDRVVRSLQTPPK